jgi:type II secretory pathway component PulC
MDVRPRRYVWIIDVIGMLAGAALAGHLVAQQIVSALSSKETRTEAAVSTTPPRRTRAVLPAPNDICERFGARQYEISRAVVDQVFSHLGSRPHGILIVPAMADGQPVGVRVFGDGYGLLHAIGLRSGDLVLEANGFPLTRPSAMLDAYAAVRQTSKARLVIQRGGRRVLFKYAIVDSPLPQLP